MPAVAAKLKCKTSLTDVPFAVTEAQILAELGWNIWDNERDVNDGLFSESVTHKLLEKYKSEEWVFFYNSYAQEHLMKELDIQPCVHILDRAKVLVNRDNDHYENSPMVKIDGETMRGYKLGVLKGVLDDLEIAVEIVFGTLKAPARENMIVYQDAVKLATASGKWHKHPNRKRKGQEIHLVTDLGSLGESDEPEKDVPINACVVHDKKTDKYFVFMTTNTGRTVRQSINTYELCPEIEEDFRQMKDFWKLEDFKSTKYNYITYHIIMTLVVYLYFQVYKNLDERRIYAGKSLPVVVKNYKETRSKSVIIYIGQYLGIFSFLEFLQLYAECTLEVRRLLDPILAKV